MLASLSWSNLCLKAASNRLSTCAFIRSCVADVVAPTLSVVAVVALLLCVLWLVVDVLVTPQLARHRALVSMRAARNFFNSFAEFVNIAA